MIYSLLVFLAAISRVMPHLPNVAPIGGLALFAGTTALDGKTKTARIAAFALPIIALLISDAVIGFYAWQVMVAVYLGFLLTAGLGLLVRKNYNWMTVTGASIAGALLFFLLTNAAVWAFTPMYTKDLAGLVESYIAALPFLRNSLIGDLAYTGLLFGSYEAAKQLKTAKFAQPAIIAR
jgi:hypothetical protein